MVIQTSEIKIDSTAGCNLIIRHTLFCVAETRSKFIYLYAVSCKTVVVGSCNGIDQFLIRNSRSDDTHIHSALGCHGERAVHLIGNDQIGSHEPCVALGVTEHVHIYILSNLLIIQRAVCIRLYKAMLFSSIWQILNK